MKIKERINIKHNISLIEEMKRLNVPNDYIDFLLNIGCGEFESILSINCELLSFSEIFDREDKHLKGMYFFGSDLGEYLFAFDSKNDWQIVEIDSSGEVFDVVASTFTEFINKKLDELIEIEEWKIRNNKIN